jgi:hypothetical protein
MSKEGCMPPPDGHVCVLCGHNVHGAEDQKLLTEMKDHYCKVHKINYVMPDFEAFLTFYMEKGFVEFATRKGSCVVNFRVNTTIGWCKILTCKQLGARSKPPYERIP